MIVVISFSRMEFLEFVESQGEPIVFQMRLDHLHTPTQIYVHIRRLDNLRGRKPSAIHFTGRWQDLDDADALLGYSAALHSVYPEIQVA